MIVLLRIRTSSQIQTQVIRIRNTGWNEKLRSLFTLQIKSWHFFVELPSPLLIKLLRKRNGASVCIRCTAPTSTAEHAPLATSRTLPTLAAFTNISVLMTRTGFVNSKVSSATGNIQGSRAMHPISLSSLLAASRAVEPPKECPITNSWDKSSFPKKEKHSKTAPTKGGNLATRNYTGYKSNFLSSGSYPCYSSIFDTPLEIIEETL